MKKKGFTLIELLVVIAIIAMLLAILMPALNKVKKIAQRVVCGTNLKGLGTAQTVYANDYEDQYTLQGRGGAHTWAANTADFHFPNKDWSQASQISVGASLYLLVREADVSPKSFVCPSSDQKAYEGQNNKQLDLVELWDFGFALPVFENTGPANCVSYSFHMPYNGSQSTGSPGRFAANATRSASFAVMADRSPYFDPKITLGGFDATGTNWIGRVGPIDQYWTNTSMEKWKIQRGNAQPHDRDGQNVTFGDGHCSYENESDVGERHDNIYTRQMGTTVVGIRAGDATAQNMGDVKCQPLNIQDSLLVNDSTGAR